MERFGITRGIDFDIREEGRTSYHSAASAFRNAHMAVTDEFYVRLCPSARRELWMPYEGVKVLRVGIWFAGAGMKRFHVRPLRQEAETPPDGKSPGRVE